MVLVIPDKIPLLFFPLKFLWVCAAQYICKYGLQKHKLYKHGLRGSW